MREAEERDPATTAERTSGSRVNVRCDAAVSAWDSWLSRMYMETLYALSRLHLN